MQFTRETNRAFDLWLNRSLAARYASTLREDVPEELLALLGKQSSRPDIADAAPVRDARGCAGSC